MFGPVFVSDLKLPSLETKDLEDQFRCGTGHVLLLVGMPANAFCWSGK